MKIKGIGFLIRVTGGMIRLKWRDPRDANRQRKHSAETNQRTEAERVALWLSRLIHTPDYWNDPPKDTHPIALKIWGAELFSDRVKKAMDLPSSPNHIIHGIGELNPAASIARIKYGLSPELSAVELELAKARDEKCIEEWKQRQRMQQEILDLKDERDQLRGEAARLRSFVQQMGKRGELNLEPVEMSLAIKEYLASSTGSRATGQFRKTVEWWLKGFEKKFGAKSDVKSINPDQVSEYLGGLLKKSAAGTVRQRMNQVCRFLRTASCGLFDERVVKSSMLPLLQKRSEETDEEEWFWLKSEEADKLIAEIRKRHGDYWADAATIQYGCALRPEEIPLLQCALVSRENQRLQIRVQRLEVSGKVLRRLKTKRSKGFIDVPDWAATSLERRLAANSYLLFPNPEPIGTGPERKLQLWPPADNGAFSGHYLRRLRDAASAVESIDAAKIDSRILRRTRARQIAEKYGLATAAVFIRDSIETLRKHYADLDSGDIRVPD